ncbi:hypothetical protein [Scytonema sp. PCC 10023]|uniref:hypothetical protein n=1 Tax=Scytonema sp. PCC 10023 TaxID=1680591 RepID=UPI0039C75BFD
MIDCQDYIIAPKRQFIDKVPSDWTKSLKQIQGVSVIKGMPPRLYIQATPPAINEIRKQFGKQFYIEEVIPHKPTPVVV